MKNTFYGIAWLCFAFFSGIISAGAGATSHNFINEFETSVSMQQQQDTAKKNTLDAATRERIKKLASDADTLNKILKEKNINAKVKLVVDTSQTSRAVEVSDDGIYISFRDMKKEKKEKKKQRAVKTQLLGLDIGINTYLYNDGLTLPASLDPLEQKLGVHNVVIHLIRQGVNIYNHNVYLVYGIAMDLNNYKFKNNYTIQPRTETFEAVQQDADFSTNKLAADFFTIPVMLHFETNPHKPSRSFDLGVGGFAGLMYSSRTKQESKEQGFRKVYDDFNLSKYRYGVSAQIGFSRLNFYANYALSGLFEKDKGPELAPLNFGVVVNGFNW